MKTKKSSFKLLQVLFLLLISTGFAFSQIAYDCLGGAYRANEFIIKFKTKDKTIKQKIREEFNAKLLLTCSCDHSIELWDVSDYLPTISPEEKEGNMSSTIEIESVDFNYLISYQPHSVSSVTSMLPPKGHSKAQIKLAMIDTGVDNDHSYFTKTNTRFYFNNQELYGTPNADDDLNCVVDDYSGYNFYKQDPNATEKEIGHGSHITGIADKISNGSLEIMNLKTFGDNDEDNTLFSVTCATYYAIDKQASVINMSWGWTGLPALCLKKAIQVAGDENCATVVCSAGNSPQSVDEYPHYPSGYGLENIIEVTALDKDDNIASYASYGSKVDIAAQGKWTSLVPNEAAAEMEGTSMAAAAISGLAARLYTVKPTATYHEIKVAIFNAALKNNTWGNGQVKNNLYFDFHDSNILQAMKYMDGIYIQKPCIDPKVTCDNITENICTFIQNNPSHILNNADCDNGGISNKEECNNGGNPHSPCDDCEVAVQAGINICAIINGDINHPLALQDCDKGGVTNFTECKNGKDPLDAKDDCVGCNNKQFSNAQEASATLFAVTPNPFESTVSITFNLEIAHSVELQIMDISGKRVYSHQNNFQKGEHTIYWNGTTVPSGVYIIHLDTGSSVHTTRLVK